MSEEESQYPYDAVVLKINEDFASSKNKNYKDQALLSLRNIKATIETAKIDVQDAFVEQIYEFFVAYKSKLTNILNNALNISEYKERDVQIENNQELITSRDYGRYLGEKTQNIRNKLNQSNQSNTRTSGSPGLKRSSVAARAIISSSSSSSKRVRTGGESDSLPPSFRVESLGFEYKDLLDSLQILNYLYVASLSACELILKRMKEGTFGFGPDYGKAVQRIETVSTGVNNSCNRVIKGYLASLPPKTLLEQIASNLVSSFFKGEEKKFQDNLLKSIQEKEKTKVFLSGNTKIWINALKEALNNLKEGESQDVVEKIDAVLEKLPTEEKDFVVIPSSSGGRRKKVKSTKKNKKSNSKKQRKSRKGRKSMRRRART